MKIAHLFCVGILTIGLVVAGPIVEDDHIEEASREEQKRADPMTIAAAIKAAEPLIKEVVAPLAKKVVGLFFGDTKWDDEILAGRSVRITSVGNTGATAKDKDTGIAITISDGQFPNKEQAVATACGELVQKLMRMRIVSVHDLGIPVPITTTPAPCEDKIGSSYCSRMKRYGKCDQQYYKSYMKENCNKTCNCASTVTMTQAELQALIAKLTG